MASAVPQPSLLDRLKGKEYPNLHDPSIFESLPDKLHYANEILRDISGNTFKLNEEQNFAVDPRRIKSIARTLWAGHMFMEKVRLVYVGWLEEDLIFNPPGNDPFKQATDYHRGMQYNIRYVNRYLTEMTDAPKIDRMCLRLIRVNSFIYKMLMSIEMCDRNVQGN